jgi:hypothetical protein
MEDLRKPASQVSALFLKSFVTEYMVKLLIDPSLISCVIEVNAAGYIGEAFRFSFFAIVTS